MFLFAGALFDYNAKQKTALFQYAVKVVNENTLKDTDIRLSAEVREIEFGDEYGAAESLCELLEVMSEVVSFVDLKFSMSFSQLGVVSIFGPKSKSAASHTRNICDTKEIPYIDTYMNPNGKTSEVNMYPSLDVLSQMIIDVVNASQWTDFTVLYESPIWLPRISALIEAYNIGENSVTVKRVDVGLDSKDFRSILNEVKQLPARNILIESSVDALPEILKQVMHLTSLAFHRFVSSKD